jgi:DHA2 family multidrug resistance protein
MITERGQFHQAELAQGATSYSPHMQAAIHNLAGQLGPAGLSTPDAIHQAYGRIYTGLVAQAQTLAFIDTFWVMAIGTLCLIPLVFFLARPERGKAIAAH